MGSIAERIGSLRDERGQVAVAFVAVVPALVLVALALLQFVLVGHATLSAAAAARADYTGGDAERAARRALPPGLRFSAAVEVGGDAVEVEVRAPRALPVGPSIPVTASTRLGPADGVPGG
ncbi:MAG TPA: hypothetical protein VFH44_03895 [Solirubrobacterales bacterium]|nr:hypothetical protein [Solirubrobacterales bacterium]